MARVCGAGREREEVKEEEAAVAAAVEEARGRADAARRRAAAAAATPSPMGSGQWLPERRAQWRQMREAKKQARDDEAEGGASERPREEAACLQSG